MSVRFVPTPADADGAELVAAFVEDPTQPDAVLTHLPAELHALASRELELGRIRAGKGDSAVLAGAAGEPARAVLVGLGKQPSGRDEAVRTAGAKIAAAARGLRVTKIALLANDLEPADVAALVEGFVLGSYRYDAFKTAGTGEGDDDTTKAAFALAVVGASHAAETFAQTRALVAEAANWARDLANAPGNHMTPAMLADAAKALAAEHTDLTFRALDRAQIESEGLGLLAGVAQGSANEPRLIVLEWNPAGVSTPDDERIALVGKAVTFDTGGISIKPAAGMGDMKMDKSGGCAVIGAMRAIAQLGIERRVLAVVGATENMPDGHAYKPGDVLTAYDGTTVEIVNTDAEGRLVLGDAIAWARSLGCDRIVEASTLTGAMVVALGEYFAGLIAVADSEWTDAVLEAARATGDHAWHLPMHDYYKGLGRSDCADLSNQGTRAGGALFAGMFLQHFAKDTPFVHLDIAGTGMLSKARDYYGTKGASGFGVRLFTSLVANS